MIRANIFEPQANKLGIKQIGFLSATPSLLKLWISYKVCRSSQIKSNQIIYLDETGHFNAIYIRILHEI